MNKLTTPDTSTNKWNPFLEIINNTSNKSIRILNLTKALNENISRARDRRIQESYSTYEINNWDIQPLY